MSFIEVRNLSHSYEGSQRRAPLSVLNNVSFEIEEGEFVSIIGPSGCGKSTLLHMLAGFASASSGTTRKQGQEIRGPGPDRAVMFQELALYPWKTILKNVELGLIPQTANREERLRIARHYLALVQLEDFENHYPAQLSGGMKQRVSIARCLAMSPDIVLMDEPFSALDSLTRDLMQEEILKIWEQERKTFLLVTHHIDEAIFMSDRVFVMSRRPGRIKECVHIDLPRPRTLSMRAHDPAFGAYRERLLTSLRKEI